MRYRTIFVLGLAFSLAGCVAGFHTTSGENEDNDPPSLIGIPQFLFVTNGAAATISGFTTGLGGPNGSVPGSPFSSNGSHPIGIIGFGTSFVYVANQGSSTISGYTFDGETGELSPLPGFPFPASTGVRSFASCPARGLLYAVADSGTISGYVPQPSSGQLVSISGSPFAAGTLPQAAAVDASCSFLFVANSGSNNISGYAINAANGALTPVPLSPFAAGTAPSSLVVDPGRKFLYVANSGSNNISGFAIDPTTGNLTPIPGSPFAAGQSPSSILIENDFLNPVRLFVADAGSNDISVYDFDPAAGTLFPIAGSPFPEASQPRFLLIELPDVGNIHALANLLVLNGQSNDVRTFGVDSSGLFGIGSSFSAGPDPQAMTLVSGSDP